VDLLPDPSLPAFPSPTLGWGEVTDTLLALAACDLDDGGPPIPRLAAFRGDEALTISTLRPHPPTGALDAVVELLALFVPLGADRVALAGGRGGTPGPVADPAGPPRRRRRALRRDRRRGGRLARGTGRSTPCGGTRSASGAGAPPRPAAGVDGATVMGAVGVILDARDELLREPWELRPQLERVLRLGHGLALSPAAAEALDVLGPPLLSPN
jgi:hypothetical protein